MSATPQQLEENKAAFEAAKAEAAETGGMVCGTYDPSGRPRYFVVPREADDLDLAKQSFALKHGRAMSPTEETLTAMAADALGGSLARRP